MNRFTRTACPTTLSEKWEEWGNRYIRNREQNPGFSFEWPEVQGKPLNQHLLPELLAMTQQHCSYCDGYPLRYADRTIDHFRPKSNPAFYGEVCKWENLYVSCIHCQKAKMEQYHRGLLRPDAEDYNFNRYFEYNYTDHTIQSNPLASLTDQERAEVTIEVFRLNEPGLAASRSIEYERFFITDRGLPWETYSFRFILI